jgi:hypothetical protein
MDYSEFIKNYLPELELMDALDEINKHSNEAAEILDRWVYQSTDEKIDPTPPPSDPN